MSKKTLLNEATVRRFMKLADMGTLSDNFINEAGLYQADEDEQMEEGHGMMGGATYQDDEPEDEMADEPMADDAMADEAPEMPEDEGPDDEMPEPEMDDADEVEISEDDRAALAAAIPVLEKIAGGAADMGDDMDMDMGDDAGMRDMKEAEEEEIADVMDEGAHLEGEKKEDEKLEEVELVDENDLVQEVTRRVAARLRAAMKSRK
tara:strand:+ start:149 stop:766 length:618 start_codon:yes stop_codon:yes gene_type:complete